MSKQLPVTAQSREIAHAEWETVRQMMIPGMDPADKRLAGTRLVVDLMCGLGGASEGIKRVLGRSPHVVCNHDPHAIALHERNHPDSRHYCEDVRALRPAEVCEGIPVWLLWLSPDCRHFSRAKGSAPVSPRVRALANVAIDWIDEVRPEIIILENVPEFTTWGPVDPLTNSPIPDQAGAFFQDYVNVIRLRGYVVEWRVLVAADFGAPTTRKRLFLIARCDGKVIRWPEPTHGVGRPHPWRTAAECIDWSIRPTSIFARKRPLAKATRRRIAKGTIRYVLGGKPFLVTLRGTGEAHLHGDSLDAPLRTISAGGTHHALVAGCLTKNYTGVVGQPLDKPLGTITAIDHHSLVAGHLVLCNHGGDDARSRPLDAPMPTITASRDAHGLIASHLIGIDQRGSGDSPTWSADRPLTTITTENRHAIAAAYLVQYYGSGSQDQALGSPLRTIVTKARHGLVGAVLGNDIAGAIRVARFLMQYGDWQPTTWIRLKGRLRPIATLQHEGKCFLLSDLAMRMMIPRELATAQGFEHDYLLDGTQEQQIRRIGNSVPPHFAAALVQAQMVDRTETEACVLA